MSVPPLVSYRRAKAPRRREYVSKRAPTVCVAYCASARQSSAAGCGRGERREERVSFPPCERGSSGTHETVEWGRN